MKPRKKWEPQHRFGGNPADGWIPPPLGTRCPWNPTKTKRKKK